jgi:hypothetical protein
MMHRSNFTRYLLGVFAASVAVSAAPFRIAGYLPDYHAATLDVEAARGWTDLDLDWEHPSNPAEEEAYADLLAHLRRAFDPHVADKCHRPWH